MAANGKVVVSFDGIGTGKPGYEGMMRRYFLDNCTNLFGDNWCCLPGVSNVMGADRTIEYTNPVPAQHGFYRAKVKLE
jgi:hypothetical protein